MKYKPSKLARDIGTLMREALDRTFDDACLGKYLPKPRKRPARASKRKAGSSGRGKGGDGP